VGVFVPAGATLVNVANVLSLVGGGLKCYPNSLPEIPIVPYEVALQDGFGGGAIILTNL
jgi:hypothetical protein